MSISPFSARPASPEAERRRAKLVVLIAIVGIAATLLAYAVSPSVRHAVGHAAHSVKGAVSHVLDRDKARRLARHAPAPAKSSAGGARTSPTRTSAGKGATSSTAPVAATPAPSR
jgi:type II secretory pathway pseudopilin PulG